MVIIAQFRKKRKASKHFLFFGIPENWDAGPYRETSGIQDSSGTLEKLENRDPGH